MPPGRYVNGQRAGGHYLWADDVNKTTLHGSMDVFVGGQWPEFARSYLLPQLGEARKHGVEVDVGKQPSLMKDLGVCLGR